MPFLSSDTFGDLGKAVGDIGGGIADIFQAQGAGIEQQAYTQAAAFAGQEAQYEQMSTAIQTTQAERETLLGQGRVTGEVAGAGFTEGGSALDILRSGAEQGALHSQVLEQQGLITTQGYKEQQQSYELMAEAAGKAASADTLGAIGKFVGAGLNLIAGGVSASTPAPAFASDTAIY